MRFLVWNPFAFLNPTKRSGDKESPQLPTTNTESNTMADTSEFQIPSAILAAALVEKSELTGKELEAYAVNTQRMLIRQMIWFKERVQSEQAP